MTSNAASRAKSGRYVSTGAIVRPRLLRSPSQRPLVVAAVALRLSHHRARTDLVLPTGRHPDLLHVVLAARIVRLRPRGHNAASVDGEGTDEPLAAELANPAIVRRVLHGLRHQTLRNWARVPSGP